MSKTRLELSKAPIMSNPHMDVEHPFLHAMNSADLRGIYIGGLNLERGLKHRITATINGRAPNHVHYRVGIRQY